MVFSSVPVYQDPPNWQPPLHQQGISYENPQQLPLPPPPPGGNFGGGSIRPGSMADRARLAKIPLPDGPQKCPRCDSTNTKFCYFNNYSLSQPRHFCKTCRRYWTRGGTLRNVPVGGGCRRNKKNKNTHSKSPAGTERQTAAPASLIELSNHLFRQPPSQLPFMSSLQTQFPNLDFPVGNSSGGSSMTSGGVEQWRPQQTPRFPFAGFEPCAGLFQFQTEALNCRVTEEAEVKTDENQSQDSAKPLMGTAENNNQYWGGNMWTDLSGVNSSSASYLL